MKRMQIATLSSKILDRRINRIMSDSAIFPNLDDKMPQIEEVDSDELRQYITFHEELNPKLWQKTRLIPRVRAALLRNALEFYRFLDVDGLKLKDVIFTGSNAAYNYTSVSDVDVHLITSFADTICPDMVENLFTTKKALWGKSHSITIKGYGVEMYVEDTTNPVKANGVFSLASNKWLRFPEKIAPEWDDAAVIAKTKAMADEIDDILSPEKPDMNEIVAMMDKIKTMRKAGLESGGEFSVENLTFKSLRNLGYLERLWNARAEAQDKTLSIF